ncbi:MAG TPA: lipoprotein-releasing system transmembrane subunit LolC, partial [Nitrospirae bacterium]|nr:lipoprotein-releasing system transmembrane subunit LolC [Nitrospirota bacterium]HEW80862.1 lipoprotein-releasing system transmembrane subunit LolC [Nitrospirota bacterium]
MNFPYQFFIALRYFRSKKKHSGISINTLISIAGVALGVMTLLTVLSVMSGFHEDLQEKILGVNPHIILLSYGGRVSDHESVMKTINSVDGVTDSSPFIYGQVMLRSGDRAQGVVVRGVDPRIGAVTTNILENIISGSVEELEADSDVPGIILGRQLLRSLGLFVGDEIDMVSPMGEMGPLGMIPKMKKFRVVGYFEAGMYEYDSNLAFISIKAAQKFFGYGNAITGIEIKTDDVYNAGEVAKRVELQLGPPFYTKDWMQMNRNLFSALKLEKIVMFIILTLII